MPPKITATATTSENNKALTPREMELLGFVWQCFETEPKINTEKFARLAGFGNPRSATNAWTNIKKKLGFGVNNLKKENGASAVKADDDGIDENDDGPSTPNPKKRKTSTKTDTGSAKKPRGRKAKDVKIEEDEEDQDAADFASDDGVKQESAGANDDED